MQHLNLIVIGKKDEPIGATQTLRVPSFGACGSRRPIDGKILGLRSLELGVDGGWPWVLLRFLWEGVLWWLDGVNVAVGRAC